MDNNKHYIFEFTNIWKQHEVDPKTVSQFTERSTCKGNEVFENDIIFTEDEFSEGDIRFYMVCKWIKEWSSFVLLHPWELVDYEDNGIDYLKNDGTFGMESIEKYHYAGNIFDNPGLLEDQE